MKKKHFILNFSLGLFILALSFFVSNTAKADITFYNHTVMTSQVNKYQDSPYMYSYADLSGLTCDDAILIMAYTAENTGGLSATFNSDPLTILSSNFTSSYTNERLTIGYLLNPDKVNGQLRINTTWSAGSWTATVFCGVDQTLPIVASSTPGYVYSPGTFSLGGIEDGDVMLAFMARGGYCDDNNATWSAGANKLNESCWGSNVFGAYQEATTTSLSMTGTSQPTYYESFSFVLRPYIPPPSSNPDTNTPIEFLDNYNLSNNSTGLVRFSYDPLTFASSTDYLSLYKCGSLPLGVQGAISCSGATQIGTSTIWTATDIAFGDPTGNGILSMTSTSTERTLYYVVPTKTGSTNLYYPEYFYVTWNGGLVLDPNDFIATTSSSSLQLLLGGVSTYSAACSYDEWNATSTFLGLNGTLLRCSFTKSALDLANIIGRIPTNVANGFISVLSQTFPFNLPIKMKQSFDASTSTLPIALTYFDIADNNGNFAITMPAEWSPNGTTTQYAVWGPAIIAETGTPNALFFGGIKSFSTYLIWFMFFMYIYHKGKEIKEEAKLERMPPTAESYPKENYRY